MIDIKTNAPKLANRYAKRGTALSLAITSGLRNLAITVDNKQVENLSGDGERGSYPVPVRSGNLRRATFFGVPGRNFAIVGNKAIYAAAIHKDRPFLSDAADSVNPAEIMSDHLREKVWAIL